MRRIFSHTLYLLVLAICLVAMPLPASALEVDVSLRGSPNSMLRQNQIAKHLGYEFVKRPADVDSLLGVGELVSLDGNEHYVINDGVSYPVARPEVRLFIERLAEQYFEGTGEQLVVTSLMRPTSEQPRNSHNLSVHPTGIAIDLRISSNRQARAWLESVLLKLEGRRLLDITRERYPPHYHVALFPGEYRTYLEESMGAEAVAEALLFKEPEVEAPVRVASLPPLMVVASSTVLDDEALWIFALTSVPLIVLAFSLLTFLGRSARREDD